MVQAQPDRAASLHRRASAWYEQNGLRPEAIRHALAAKDFGHAVGLIELAGPATDDRSIHPTTWLGWAKMLPEELVRAQPVLNVWYAYALLGRGELEAAEARFEDTERWLEQADVQLETPSAESCPEPFGAAQDKLRRRMVVVDQEQLQSLPVTIAIGRAYFAQALGNIPDTL